MNSARARLAQTRDRARRWNEAMLAEAEDQPRLGTRWGRGASALVPAGAAVVGLGLAITHGVLAANFAVNDQAFTIHAKQLEGTGLGGVLAAEGLGSGSKAGVLHAGLASAALSGICILVHQSVLGVDYTIAVSSGSGNASGDNVYFDVSAFSASPATLKGAILGESADAVTVNGNPLGGARGGFGLDVSKGTASLTDVDATAYQAQVAGALTLQHMSINVSLGKKQSC